VEKYLDVFGNENVQVILYDDFVKDTQKTVMETLQFLGVDSNLELNYKVVNVNKQVRSFFLHRLMRNPSPRFKKMAITILPLKKVRHYIMAFVFRKIIKVKKRKEMSSQLYAGLKEKLMEDIVNLEKLIGKDLSAWKK
jgi:hypothetical protein